jgi:uncharacterized protein YsxB (DUF464 family)
MITAELSFDRAGILKWCRVTGHAGAGMRGNDIVCAAVSVLLQTVYRTLYGRVDIHVRGDAPERGISLLEVETVEEGSAFLFAAGAFLREGLCFVAEEYPECCTVIIT